MSSKKSRKQHRQDEKTRKITNKHERDVAIATAFTESDNKKEIYKELIKWIGISVIGVCTTVSIFFVSGKTTNAEISLSGALDTGGSDLSIYLVGATVFSFVFGIGCLSISRSRRKLMEEKIEQLSGPKREEELVTDPGRSSSNLTNSGTTPEKLQ